MTETVYSLDVETHALANLKAVGSKAYLRDPDTDVILFAYHEIGSPNDPSVWVMGDAPPRDLVDHVNNGGALSGWNVLGFDAIAWDEILVKRHGFPPIQRHQWQDSMQLAAAANLPRSLDGCAKAVGVPYVGDLKDNNTLRRITNKKQTPVIRGVDLKWLRNRCVQDVVMEEETLKRLPPWFTMPPWNRMRDIDRRINDRGVLMDVELVKGLRKIAEEETARLDAAMKALTNGAVRSTSVIEQLKTWLMSRGVELPLKGSSPADEEEGEDEDEDDGKKAVYRLRKSDIADILARPDIPDDCRQALEWRAEAAKASVKKLKKMLVCADDDGRLRGALVLGGAAQTLRFASKDWQGHNFVRDTIGTADDIEAVHGISKKKDPVKFKRLAEQTLQNAIETGRKGDRDLAEMLWTATRKDAQGRVRVEGVLPWVGRMLRRTLTAQERNLLLNGDYAQVEARIPVWLSAQTDKVEAFRNGVDMYRLQASPIFGKSPEDLSSTERQSGKVTILSCNFAGGVNAFVPMAMNYGLRISREEAVPIVKGYRDDNPQLVKYWDVNLEAARNAVAYPGKPFTVGPTNLITWYLDGNCLKCYLPSSRPLRYWGPRLETGYWPDGGAKSTPDLTVLAIKGRAVFRRALWRGLAIENCLARSTIVLTNAGWKPICDVSLKDLLWDGEQWVTHNGVVYQGDQTTMDFGGVRMTPDHKVLINANWTSASEGTPREATRSFRRYHRTPTPLPGCREISWIRRTASRVVDTVRLWKHKTNDGSVVQKLRCLLLRLQNTGVEAGFVGQFEGKSNYAWDVKTSGILGVALNGGSMPSSNKQGVAQLRRSRNYGVRALAEIFRGLLGRYGAYVSAGTLTGSNRQQWQLSSGQLPLDYDRRSESQSTGQRVCGDAVGSDDCSGCVSKIGHRSDNAAVSGKGWLSINQNVCQTGCHEPVFDILNAGPRRRFTVLGTDGPFIVSNCTQAIAADMLATAICNCEDAGLPVIWHTHDSINAEVPKSQAEKLLPAFEKAMLSQPSWTAGLPIAVSCDISARFG